MPSALHTFSISSGLADLLDNLLVAEERRLHETLLIGFVDRFQRMRILSVSYDEPTFSPRLSLGYEVI